MDKIQVEQLLNKGMELVMGYVPKLALALLTLIVGLWLAKSVGKLVRYTAEKRKVDATLVPFLASIVTWAMRVAVFISAASVVGIQTTSFVAVLGAAGLAIGLALQGSLSNFAGGALILIFRPFKVGDVIEAQGHIGSVREIQLFTTVMVNGQNRRIILPNGPLANGSIVNYTVEGTARVDMVIGVAYEADVEEARKVLMGVLEADSRVLKDPLPRVEVLELGDNSVNLVVRPHVKVSDYWDVHFDTMKNAKLALDKAGIGIPYPQRDVHLYQHSA